MRGIHLALVTALISGVSIFVNKYAVDAIRQPLVFTSVKNAGVAVLILTILFAGRKWKQISKLTRKERVYLLLIGVIGGSIPFYLFFTGLATIPAINGAIIQKTLVIWVTILAIPFLKEKLTRKAALAVAILFGANVLVGGFSGFKWSTGEGLILAATLLWAVETVLAKKILPTVDPDIVTAARMGIGAVILLIMSAIMQPAALGKVTALNLTQMAWVGVTMVLLFFYVRTWYRALKYAPAITVTAILVASTLITNVLSAVFVTHTVSGMMVAQAALMMAGVGTLWRLTKAEATINEAAVSPASG